MNEMTPVLKATTDFNFSQLSLADPIPLLGQSGWYFTQFLFSGGNSPCFQLPKGEIKDGFIKTKTGQQCDIKYNKSQSSDLIGFLEMLVCTCQEKLNEKKTIWFQTELSSDDIESMMAPIFRIYQSYKYILVRLQALATKADKCIIYDINHIGVDSETVTANKPVIPLVVLDGIRFSSTNFEICLKVVQLMVLESSPRVCLITQDDAGVVTEATTGADETTSPESVAIEPSLHVPSEISQPPWPIAALPPLLPQSLESVAADESVSVTIPEHVPVLVSEPSAAGAVVTHNSSLEEITLDIDATSDKETALTLKKPNEIFYSIYKAAREKAKQLRTVAIEAYLEAKAIKAKYMLTDMEDDDDDDDDEEEDDDDDDGNEEDAVDDDENDGQLQNKVVNDGKGKKEQKPDIDNRQP